MIKDSIILGIIQGLTEFLPVSSSGHLVIFQEILKFNSPGATFEVVLHLGTMLAVIIYFREKILNISFDHIKLIIIGTIPAVIVGLLFKDQIEALFSSTKIVSFALLITALINFNIDRFSGSKEKLDSIDAIIIGIAQSLAITPGISRSGSTILAARFSKIEAEKAAEFSFLLSIPAIVGANILELSSSGFDTNLGISTFIFGFLASFVSGLVAIKLVIGLLKSRKFKIFGAYCFILGLASLLFL